MNAVPSFLPIDYRSRQFNRSAVTQESPLPELCQYFQLATNSKVNPFLIEVQITGMAIVRLASILETNGATIQFINPGANSKLIISGGDVGSNLLLLMI